MSTRLIIGNSISLLSCVMLLISSTAKDRDKVYKYQVAESALAVIAAVFFASWSGLSTLCISLIRNILVWKNRLSKFTMVFLTILLTIVGLIVNNRGVLGYLPIIATIELSIANYYCRKLLSIKIAITINTSIWAVYSFFIQDYASTTIEAVIIVMSFLSIYMIIQDNKLEKLAEIQSEK